LTGLFAVLHFFVDFYLHSTVCLTKSLLKSNAYGNELSAFLAVNLQMTTNPDPIILPQKIRLQDGFTFETYCQQF